MDTSRFVHLFVHHLPEFFKRKFSVKENFQFASMTNLSDRNEEHCIYDTDGCLLFMQTTQSNLSLFNISCDSLIIDDDEVVDTRWNPSMMRHSTSSNRSAIGYEKMSISFDHALRREMFSSKTHALQRWQGLELLNTYA